MTPRWSERLKGFLFDGGRSPEGTLREKGRFFGRVLYLSVWKFNRDFCFDQAASLAFATILSLIPFAVLFFSFVGLLGGGERIIHFVQEKILPAVVPEFQEQVVEWLERYISPTVFKAGPAGLINLAALVGLIMGALNILITAERVFNHIWRAKGTRHYFQKVTAFWVLLTSSPFVILASMWVGNVLVPQGGAVESFLRRHWLANSLYALVAPVLVETVCFALIYFFLPSARVRLRNAVIAGLCAALLWELSKKGFYLYVSRAGEVTNFYRQLAAVPLFFLWLFLTWIIVLWGGQVSYALQNAQSLTLEQQKGENTHRFSQVSLGLFVLFRVYGDFLEGRPSQELERLADDLGIPQELLADIAEFLGDRNVLVEDARHPGRYTLGRHPSRIALGEVVRWLHEKEFPGETPFLKSEGGSGKNGSATDHGFRHPAHALLEAALRGYFSAFDGKSLEAAWQGEGLSGGGVFAPKTAV